jgi:hypothetical protein
MATFTVTLHGAPIATVDLPVDRVWAGGRVTPLPSFDQVAPLLAAAAEAPSLVAMLLDLPSGDAFPSPATDRMAPAAAAAYEALAAMTFDLLDEAGLPAGAELVRLGPSGAGTSAVVRVYFRHAPDGVVARISTAPHVDGGAGDAPGA